MKTLLENYIEASNNYVDSMKYLGDYEGPDRAKELDKAGRKIFSYAKEKGLDINKLKTMMIQFISSNVHRKTKVKNVAEHFEYKNKNCIEALEQFLGEK